MKRCWILLLVGALLLSSACRPVEIPMPEPVEISPGIDAAPETTAPEQEKAPVHFDRMVYTEPDLPALGQQADALLERAKGEGATPAVLEDYAALLAGFQDASDQMNLAYLFYALDVTDQTWQDIYAEIREGITALDVSLTEISVCLLEDTRCPGAARAAWGDDFSDTVLREQNLNAEEIQPMLKREQELIFRYDELLGAYAYEEGGKRWTPETLSEAYLAAEIPYEEYLRCYDAYTDGLNRAAGEIFLELLPLRNEIARTLGYGNYAAYCYDCYGRDYTLQEAQGLHEAVKQTLVPLYQRMVVQGYAFYQSPEQSFGLEGFLDSLQKVAADFAPQVEEALDFMLNYGLYDLDDSENKMSGAFTTYLGAYDAPFILGSWTGYIQSVRMVIHELGHFANYYHAGEGGWSCSDPLDLAEVDSQGLELLLSAYDNTFFGKNMHSATMELLSSAVYSVISGCMEDEFQQRVYASPDMSLDTMNALYLELAGEYGLAGMYGYTGKEWVMIPHTFQSPMYYISYATSMVMALEIWQLGQKDFDAARDSYLAVLQRPFYSEFRQLALDVGLADPMSAGAVEEICLALEARIFED